jgi:hypothetical protein
MREVLFVKESKSKRLHERGEERRREGKQQREDAMIV